MQHAAVQTTKHRAVATQTQKIQEGPPQITPDVAPFVAR